MLSAINALHLMATRVIFAMSRDGLFTTKAAVVNKGGTPTVSLFAERAGRAAVHRFRCRHSNGHHSARVFLCR